MKPSVKFLARGACIAALYAAVTVITQAISFGPLQLRLAEALTVLPYLMPEAVWGLTLGCLIANLFGGTVLDIVFGTLATFLAALITRHLRHLFTVPLPTILANALIVGAVVTLNTVEFSAEAFLLFVGSIAVSETLVTYCLGLPLLTGLHRLSKKVPFLR